MKEQNSHSQLIAKNIASKVKELAFDGLFKSCDLNFYWMDKDGYFLGCNANELKALNLSSYDELIGKHSDEVAHPEAWQNSKRVMENNQSLIVEEIHIEPSGEKTIYLSIKSPMHDEADKVIGLVGVSFDITKRKRVEKSLWAAKEGAAVTN